MGLPVHSRVCSSILGLYLFITCQWDVIKVTINAPRHSPMSPGTSPPLMRIANLVWKPGTQTGTPAYACGSEPQCEARWPCSGRPLPVRSQDLQLGGFPAVLASESLKSASPWKRALAHSVNSASSGHPHFYVNSWWSILQPERNCPAFLHDL